MAKQSSRTTVGLALLMALVAMSSLGMKATEAACPNIDLDSCLPAAAADVDPTTECCTNLTTYTSTADGTNDLTCLCEAAMGSAYFTSNSVTYAVLIPQKCNLNYAAGTECSGKLGTYPGPLSVSPSLPPAT